MILVEKWSSQRLSVQLPYELNRFHSLESYGVLLAC